MTCHLMTVRTADQPLTSLDDGEQVIKWQADSQVSELVRERAATSLDEVLDMLEVLQWKLERRTRSVSSTSSTLRTTSKYAQRVIDFAHSHARCGYALRGFFASQLIVLDDGPSAFSIAHFSITGSSQ
eukprot:6189159-Pleurochrysis_carterae.AAC.2